MRKAALLALLVGCVDPQPTKCGQPPDVHWTATDKTVTLSTDDFVAWADWTACVAAEKESK